MNRSDLDELKECQRLFKNATALLYSSHNVYEIWEELKSICKVQDAVIKRIENPKPPVIIEHDDSVDKAVSVANVGLRIVYR